LRQKRRPPTDKWHLDKVFVTINLSRLYLWRAVDSDGMVLDIPLQERRNAAAPNQFLENVLESTPSRPRVIITDGLRSYGIVSRELLPDVEHRRSNYLSNRVENSHQPTRRREKRMQRFKSPDQAQAFPSFFGIIYDNLHFKKYSPKSNIYRNQLALRFDYWIQLTS